jgi:hypothetical protein
MDSIENPKDEVTNRSYFPYSEPMSFNMLSLDTRLGEFARASIRPPSLHPFLP